MTAENLPCQLSFHAALLTRDQLRRIKQREFRRRNAEAAKPRCKKCEKNPAENRLELCRPCLASTSARCGHPVSPKLGPGHLCGSCEAKRKAKARRYAHYE